jgi:hypothetical protein
MLIRVRHPSVAVHESGLFERCRDRSLPLEMAGWRSWAAVIAQRAGLMGT